MIRSEREKESRPRLVSDEQIHEPRHAFARSAVRAHVNLEPEIHGSGESNRGFLGEASLREAYIGR
ncbi:hypothetical protein D3C83_287170 [compost metagenome]